MRLACGQEKVVNVRVALRVTALHVVLLRRMNIDADATPTTT